MKKSIKVITVVMSLLLIISLLLGVASQVSNIVPGSVQYAEFGGVSPILHSVAYQSDSGDFTQIEGGHLFSFGDDITASEIYISYMYEVDGVFKNESSPEYLTFDFDIALDGYESKLLPYLLFFDGSKNVGTTQIVILSSEGDNTLVEYQDNGVVKKSRVYLDDVLHFTYVYNFTDVNAGGMVRPEVNVYINGVFFENYYPCGGDVRVTKFLNHFRFHTPKKYCKVREGGFKLTNVECNYFSQGYEGAITELFESHLIKLQDCTDSILFGKD